MSQKDQPSLEQRLKAVHRAFWELGQFFAEIFKGFARQDEILFRYIAGAVIMAGLIVFRCDVWLFKRIGIWSFYPPDGWVFKTYALSVLFLPILAFGLRRRTEKRQFARSLKEVFDLVGLKNALGSYPSFLSLDPMTGGTIETSPHERVLYAR